MSAFATVNITVQVSNCGTWGDNITVSQIRDQAIESALGKLSRSLNKGDFKIIGTPEISMITTDITKKAI